MPKSDKSNWEQSSTGWSLLLTSRNLEHDSQKQPQESTRVLPTQSTNLKTDAVRSGHN